MPHHRTEDEVDQFASTSLDIGLYGHAGGQVNPVAIDHERRIDHGDGRREAGDRTLRGFLLDRIGRDGIDHTLDQTIFGEGKGIDLDLGALAFTNEAAITVLDQGFDQKGEFTRSCENGQIS